MSCSSKCTQPEEGVARTSNLEPDLKVASAVGRLVGLALHLWALACLWVHRVRIELNCGTPELLGGVGNPRPGMGCRTVAFTMQSHSASKRKDIVTPARMDLEDIVLGGGSQSQRDGSILNSERQKVEGWLPGLGAGGAGGDSWGQRCSLRTWNVLEMMVVVAQPHACA